MIKKIETAIFGAGCFWGVEETFRKVNGVLDTEVGYMGGHSRNPTYKDVCSHKTGHVEVVKVKYNPSVTPYKELLNIFWNCHNPTTVNRQGLDFGEQYKSIVFYTTPKQKELAEKSKKELEKSGKYKNKIVTQIVKAGTFYRAEEYHQKYLIKKGLQYCHI